jgi:uncharacterized coiled-coil DUF342 family protein
MITPQVKAIEEKFSRGEGLTQTDIHTLLLKSLTLSLSYQ